MGELTSRGALVDIKKYVEVKMPIKEHIKCTNLKCTNFFLSSYQNRGTSNYPEILERMEVRNQKVQVTLVVHKLDI